MAALATGRWMLARATCCSRAVVTSRALSTSARLANATPDWEQLVGGKQGIERRRRLYEEKYAAIIESKAKEQGMTVDELRRRTAEAEQARQKKQRIANSQPQPVEAGSEQQGRPADKGPEAQPTVVRPPPSATAQAASEFTKPKDGPVKPLHSIMDLTKATELNTNQLSQLWTTYHQTKGFLSAAIPVETYNKMIETARKYPMFVLPLGRDVPGEQVDGSDKSGAVEMHLMEWALLPQPPNVTEAVPSPSTVLFTPLAEYKARQQFSQPYLILTHYTDLAASHNVVLMRGDVTDNVALDQLQAQMLAVRMQLFYNNIQSTDVEMQRQELLKTFHEQPDQFDLEKLIKVAEVSQI
ncbi:hypothetical protein OIV83_004937 [Microbotryomycetes sp. JL201]|nr:hypothetical protein OIV83_004937 [Microbotryomycetes sp. JL201]